MRKTIKLFFVFAVLLISAPIQADWPVIYSGFSQSNNGANAVTTDDLGNCYVTGFVQTQDQGYWIYHTLATIKYNSLGEQVWATTHRLETSQGEGMSIVYYHDQSMEEDYIYVTGRCSENWNPNWNYYDIITIKYNASNGTEVWSSRYSDFDCCGNKIDCDGEGNVYVAGKSHGPIINGFEYGNYFTVLKYSANGGSPLWVRTYSRNYNDVANSLKVNGSFVYATGFGSNGTDNDIITKKYGIYGDEVWTEKFDNGGNDSATDLTVSATFGIFVAGTSYISGEYKATTMRYGYAGGSPIWVNSDYSGVNSSVRGFVRPIAGEQDNPNSSFYTIDIFTTGFGGAQFPYNSYGQTIKYNASGVSQWVRTRYSQNLNRLMFNALKICSNENVYVTGYDTDPGYNYNSWYVLKYNSSGDLLLDDNITTYTRMMSFDIALDNNDNAFATGFAAPQSLQNIIDYSENDPYESYFFTNKYINDDNKSVKFKDINKFTNLHKPDKYLLEQNYPNPFNPVTNIKYQLPVSGNVVLKIYDITGKEVAKIVDENKVAGYYTAVFDASRLSSGMYFYRILCNGFIETKKMMLVK